MWVCLADVAKEFFNVWNLYLSYQMMSDLLGVELNGNARNLPAMIRAEFVVECARVLFSSRPLERRHVQIADFSSLQESQKTPRVKTIGDYKTSPVCDIHEIIKKPKDQRFEGCYFAFTGTLKVEGKKSLQRKAAMEIIKNMGGHSTESFDQNVTHLVKGIIREKEIEANGMTDKEIKLMKWNSLGKNMVIISAEDFMRLIET